MELVSIFCAAQYCVGFVRNSTILTAFGSTLQYRYKNSMEDSHPNQQDTFLLGTGV